MSCFVVHPSHLDCLRPPLPALTIGLTLDRSAVRLCLLYLTSFGMLAASVTARASDVEQVEDDACMSCFARSLGAWSFRALGGLR